MPSFDSSKPGPIKVIKPKKPKKKGHGALGFKRTGGNTYTKKGSVYTWRRNAAGNLERVAGSARSGPGKKKPPAFDPLQPLTGKAFNREVNAQTNLQYGPQERSSLQAQSNIPTWYRNYQQALAQSAGQIQQAYQQGQASVTQQANTMRAQDAQFNTAQQQQGQASAAQRGATVDPNVAATDQRAAAGRQALASSFGGMLATQGAAQTARGLDQQRIATGAQVQAQTNESNRYRQILSDKAQAKIKNRSDLQDRERTYALNQQAYGLDVAKAGETNRANRERERRNRASDRAVQRDKAHDNKLNDKTYQETLREHGRVEADRQWKRDHPSKGKGGGKGARHAPGYGRTNVSLAQGLSHRRTWQGLTSLGPHDKVPTNTNGYLRRVLGEYDRNGGAVSKRTALKVWRTFGFRIPVAKTKKHGDPHGGHK